MRRNQTNEKNKIKTNKLDAKSHIIYLESIRWVQFQKKRENITNNYSSWSNKKPINLRC